MSVTVKLCPICEQPMHRSPTGHSCGACKAFFASDPFTELFSAHNMGMTDDQMKRFAEASNHPYACRCPICLDWWALVGPEPED